MNLVMKKNTWKDFQIVPFSSLTSKILRELRCCNIPVLESDAEIQFHGEKYFQENLIVLLNFFFL